MSWGSELVALKGGQGVLRKRITPSSMRALKTLGFSQATTLAVTSDLGSSRSYPGLRAQSAVGRA